MIPTHQDLFRDSSWFAVLHGQGVEASAYHPIADALSEKELRSRIDATYREVASKMSTLS